MNVWNKCYVSNTVKIIYTIPIFISFEFGQIKGPKTPPMNHVLILLDLQKNASKKKNSVQKSTGVKAVLGSGSGQ